MPVYQYKGLRSDGQGTAGVIDAESLKGARHKLRQGGVYPTDVSEQRQSDGVGRGSILSSGVGAPSSLLRNAPFSRDNSRPY